MASAQSIHWDPQYLDRPECPKCGTQMVLARIEPDKPDYDRRTFECAQCGHSESLTVKYR